MRVCVRQTAFLTVRVRAPQADLCGQDNSIEATGLPEFIEPQDDRFFSMQEADVNMTITTCHAAIHDPNIPISEYMRKEFFYRAF